MLTILRYSLRRQLGQILGWGLSLAVLGAYLVGFYDTLANQQESLQQLLSQYPPELMAIFGGMEDMFTPSGYLNVEFFSYMPLILGIYAVLTGSGLLVSDEESGTLDLVLAHPINRSALYFGRLLAFLIAVAAILGITWLGFILVEPGTKLEVGLWKMALPFLSLYGILALFGALALLLSMLLPSRRMAAMTAGLVLVASFFLTTLASLDQNLKDAEKFSPLHYYQGGKAILGLEESWLLGLLGFALIFALLGWWRFVRRDIRVGGEGGWRIPWLKRMRRSQPA